MHTMGQQVAKRMCPGSSVLPHFQLKGLLRRGYAENISKSILTGPAYVSMTVLSYQLAFMSSSDA